ncbi:ent-kaurenoic acid oxidase 1-like isoform X2 [Amaranthus tricolor]|uniref:ent-kaurenoic acid oxidase 1-like isoform X2 n=1 Tax=Amaranthus tricolor TaxID=29722 RepID=UPI00258A1940|nr:ent-kaurenoic acid oxidase 1-like isoform X2 [Amaranthus tricolor]
MELGFISKTIINILGVILVIILMVRRINSWVYEYKLGEKRHNLPPGDLGLPYIGNMWSFLRAFKSTNPDSFINTFITRYGKTGIYKAFMFGSPSIIVTSAETCRKVLNDDEKFKPGWPESTAELIGRQSFIAISYEEHKRLRRVTSTPINGHEALSQYVGYIESIVQTSLEKWCKMGDIEFLTHLRKLTFQIIMYIFLSSESEPVMEALEREYSTLNYGVRSMAINLPGFAYHKALKARKRLVAVFQSIIDERRALKRDGVAIEAKKDMMDDLLEVEDEDGRKLTDQEIIDVLVMYLNAGHESSGHTMMWATVLLQQHPEVLHKVKAEQEEIVKNRPANQKGLTLKEVRQMTYLSQVIDETLRWLTFSFVVFREAISDVKINGYTIPKGWKVLVWFRTCHLDPETWPEPMKFNPSRWDDFVPKAGTFLPFGAGSRLCPGNDLAKLEISIFLHYFILNYRLARVNPDCTVQYLPHRRPKDNCLGKVIKI